jgi:hypothetical protein
MAQTNGSHYTFLEHGLTVLYLTPSLSREPAHVPLAQTTVILDHNLKGRKINGGHGIEGNVEDDQGPLEKGVGGVSCGCQSSCSLE